MGQDLKAQNSSPLAAIYIGTLLLVAFVHWSVEEVFDFSLQLGQQALVVAAITSFGGVLSNVLPNTVKHGLVYMRFRNALSGHRCYQICMRDARFHEADLKDKWPVLFGGKMKESEQNKYWYREIYWPIRNSPEIAQAHRSFLLYRDAATGLYILLTGLVVWNATSGALPIPAVSLWSVAVVVGVVAMLCRAAQQSGDRMVANAVAVALAR